MRAILEHALDFIEADDHTPLGTLLFMVYALAAGGGCIGLAMLSAHLFGWYALAALIGTVALSCAYIAGKDSRKHT